MSAEREKHRDGRTDVVDATKNGPLVLRSLLESLYDHDREGKERVITAFRQAPDSDVYPLLLAALRDNVNDRARNAAMELYVALRSRSLPFLIALLEDANEEVRTFSGVMLGTLKDSGAVPALVTALGDSDMNVKHAAAEALGKIGDSRAVEPLIDALMMDMWLQFPATIALGEIGDSRAVKPLIKLLAVPGANVPAIQALGKLADPSALEPLAGFLADDEPALREWALEAVVETFSRMSTAVPVLNISARTKEMLIQSLTVDDRPGVRKNAAVALGYFRVYEAVNVLKGLLEDGELGEAARSSLARIEGSA